jgi:hypothetical protein
MVRIAIHQPNYAPWLGYFAKMASADVFVFLDDCQMPIGRSYVSRVQIRGREGAEWMTIPVQRSEGQAIRAVKFADRTWTRKHLGTFRANYARCPYYHQVVEILRPIYEDAGDYLAPFNMRLIRTIANYLGLNPRFCLESEIPETGTSTQRLIDLVRFCGGTTYVSGLGGTNYQDPAAFLASGIDLDVRRYQPVEYRQIQGDFVPGLSVFDALFHLGPSARTLLCYTETGPVPAVTVEAEVPAQAATCLADRP